MRIHQPRKVRRGATLMECAVVAPLTFMLLLGLVVGAMGIFRYQEVASLARAGARYASTHGNQYRKDAGQDVGSPGTSASMSNGFYWYQANPKAGTGSDQTWTGDIYDQAIRPSLVALDTILLTVQVGWPEVINQNKADNWPGSRVSVTVSYTWMPELYFVGPINLTSTSTMPITN